MKHLPLLAALLSLGLATACNTVKGAQKDIGDVHDWAHNKPSTLSSYAGYAPRGYVAKTAEQAADEDARKEALASSEPPAMYSDVSSSWQLPETSGGRHSWSRVDNYSLQNVEQENAYIEAGDGLRYNNSVQVFPVDGDETPYESLKSLNDGSYSYSYTSDATPPQFYARDEDLAQKVYFKDGSAKVGRVDRKALEELSSSLSANGKDYKVKVVGHASKGPKAQKLANHKIAQKRADAVADVMIESGVPSALVKATSAGDTQPARTLGGKTQAAADRRADVFVAAQ